MDEFISALVNPTIWASVVITLLVGLILKFIPKFIKLTSRGMRLKELRKVKNIRHNQDAVTFQSIKAHSYFLVFMGTLALFLVLFAIGPLKELALISKAASLLALTPVFIMEIIWLNQDSYAQNLIKRRGKLRVTSISKRTRKKPRAL